MNWFYAYQGQRAGPVDDDEFARLVGNGTVADQTLVWRNGMPDWMPFAQARAIPLAPAAPVAGSLASPAADGVSQAQCSQCGRVFPADEVIRLEGFNVCAACKPILIQRMRQGMSPAYGAYGVQTARFGGFWIRWGAVILDYLIMIPVTMLLGFVAGYVHPATVFFNAHEGFLPVFGFQGVVYGIYGLYESFFVGRFGGTPGKLICGLRVVRSDGSRVTYGRAIGRFFAKLLRYFTLYLGYLIAAFDTEKRALHDHICDTRVVYKQ